MFKTGVRRGLPILLLTLCGCASQPTVELPPSVTTEPVRQDADWSKDWWKKRHDEKLAQADDADIELVFLGDSITHGWENAGAEVFNTYFGDRKTLNLGFAGDRTEHVLWRLQNGAIDGIEPKLVILMIGTNNTGYRMDPAAATAAGIERIVVELRQQLPTTKVLLLAIFPRHRSPANEMRQRNTAINELIAVLDDGETVHFEDLNPAFLHADGALREDLLPDLLHPNAAGYKVWAEAMAPMILPLLR